MEPNTPNNTNSQPVVENSAPVKPQAGLAPNIAAALSYIIPPISGIYFFATEKTSRFVKFHAFQSILFGIIYIAIFWLIPYQLFFIEQILSLVGFLAWLFLMWKAYNNVEFELPIIGKIAKDQANK